MAGMKDLFGDKPYSDEVRGMVRQQDHVTSINAAHGVNEIKTKLQARVLELLSIRHMTDGELETLPEFSDYRYSTVRKRRSELLEKKLVEWTGERRNGQKVWRRARSP